MSRSLIVEFTKMQGAGNDFLVIDNRWYRFSDAELSDLAARWCPRRTGVGADGLLALSPVEEEDVDFRMRYVNADGSMATMCGNGARCLARYALSSGFEGPEVVFATDAGPYRAWLQDGASGAASGAGEAPTIRLYVPDAQRMQRDVPLAGDLPPGVIEADFVWTGTEHLVLFVEDAEAWPDDEVARWGERLRHDEALAPEGANANFVSGSSTESGHPELHVRTFEKGVEAETLSCGTGVLAAVAAARERGRVHGGPVDVVTRGGRLRVGTETSDGAPRTYLEGPVETVFRGTLEIDGS
jgi:diaminopimelate epimerase